MNDPNNSEAGEPSLARETVDFLSFLLAHNIIDGVTRDRAASVTNATGQAVDTVLLELGLVDEATLAQSLATYLSIDEAQPSDFPDETAAPFIAHIQFMQRHKILATDLSDRELVAISASPLDNSAARALAYLLDARLRLKVTTRGEIERQLQRLIHVAENSFLENSKDVQVSDIERLHDIASEAPIVRLLGRIVSDAVDRSASDIHIECSDDRVRVRFRIDGILQVVESVPVAFHLGLVSRIKILARLNIAEQRLPQDGRIGLAIKGRNIDFRVATSPTSNGENVVLRILDKRLELLDLATLGFDTETKSAISQILTAPNGIILVTGPTGSGKTTSLYAILSELNSNRTKIFTVEDPVEYNLKGVSQIQVRPEIDLDFAKLLRSILRQDPDIIMVGEIRDGETAKIAVQAALTGHLVLSTLHTNSATSSITRLRNLGIDDHLIGSSLRAVVAQRLVRRLCPNLNKKEHLAHCTKCGGTGYSGRTVVYEVLEISPTIRAAIVEHESEDEIERKARTMGMKLLSEVGEDRVQERITSREEIGRVLGLGTT